MPKFTFICQECGKEKEARSQAEANKRKFCSLECSRASFSKNFVKKGKGAAKDESKNTHVPKAVSKKEAPYPKRNNRRSGIQIVDMERPNERYRRKEILLAMRVLARKIGKEAPTERDWIQHQCKPSLAYVIKQFGNWSQAVKAMKSLPPRREYKLSKTRISG
jgi:hypothetical protein